VSAAAGLSVTLVDASAAACANGVGMIKKSLERQHKKAAEKDGASAEVWRRRALSPLAPLFADIVLLLFL
jgi:3-hydroxyacyl-CoA dehydrogenase